MLVQGALSSVRKDPIRLIWKSLLVSFPYFLIFHLKISNAIIILLLVTAVVECVYRKKCNPDLRSLAWASSLFLLSLGGIVYTTDVPYGLSLLDSRLPLILLPITFSLKGLDRKDQQLLLRHFYFSLALTFAVCVGYAFYRNIHGPWPEVWFNQYYWHYTDFTELINIHPLYLSLYIAFAILLIVIDVIGLEKRFPIGTFGKLSILLWLMIFIVLLSSRWIMFVCVAVIALILIWQRKRITSFWTLAFFGFLTLFVVLTLFSPVTRHRIISTFDTEFVGSEYSLDRFVIWSIALDYVTENPEKFVLGQGTGSSKKMMENQYRIKNIQWDFHQKTNTHNQYLNFFLDTGFIGVSWFILFFFVSGRNFYLQGNWLGVSFILLFSLAMVCENYLQQQKGIAFYAFIYSIIHFNCKMETNVSKAGI